jgi:hypothetical protein
MADDARARADGECEAAGMLVGATGRPLASWQALKDALAGTGSEAETALSDAAAFADALTSGMTGTATATDGAGGAARDAGVAAAEGADTALTDWHAVTAALQGNGRLTRAKTARPAAPRNRRTPSSEALSSQRAVGAGSGGGLSDIWQ